MHTVIAHESLNAIPVSAVAEGGIRLARDVLKPEEQLYKGALYVEEVVSVATGTYNLVFIHSSIFQERYEAPARRRALCKRVLE